MKRPRIFRHASWRTVLKILRWGILVALFFWFVLVQPRYVLRWGAFWVDIHPMFGLIFVSGTLLWFGVAVAGFFLGLTSSVQLWAGNIVPIAYPMGWPRLNDLVGIVHSIEFYTVAALAVTHGGFHIWRYIKLRDNALRIMAPKVFHRYL